MSRTSDTEERLVDAASALWHSRSYADVGVSEICDVADVRKGSFYHFFSSKQELAVAVIDRRWNEDFERIVMPALDAGESPLGRIRALLVGIAHEVGRLTEVLGSVPGCPSATSRWSSARSTTPSVRGWSSCSPTSSSCSRRSSTTPWRRARCPLGTGTDEVARAMIAYVEGVLLMSKNANDGSSSRTPHAARPPARGPRHACRNRHELIVISMSTARRRGGCR